MSTMKEVLNKFKKELKTTYQAQKNIVDVTDKYIGLLENAESGGGYTPIDYSTDEQDTGVKWVDGKSVYRKTFTEQTINLNGDSWVEIAVGISIDTLISFDGYTSLGMHACVAEAGIKDTSHIQISTVSSAFNRTISTFTIVYTKK